MFENWDGKFFREFSQAFLIIPLELVMENNSINTTDYGLYTCVQSIKALMVIICT